MSYKLSCLALRRIDLVPHHLNVLQAILPCIEKNQFRPKEEQSWIFLMGASFECVSNHKTKRNEGRLCCDSGHTFCDA